MSREPAAATTDEVRDLGEIQPASGDDVSEDPDPNAVTPGEAHGSAPVSDPGARGTRATTAPRPEGSAKGDPSAVEATPSTAPTSTSTFDERGAQITLWQHTAGALRCKDPAVRGTEVTVTATFLPSGELSSAVVSGTFEGTSVDACLEQLYRGARIEPFSGPPRRVYHSYSLR